MSLISLWLFRDLVDVEEYEGGVELDVLSVPIPGLQRPASCSELQMAVQNGDSKLQRVPSHSQIAAK